MAQAKADEHTCLLRSEHSRGAGQPKEFPLSRQIIIVTAVSLVQLVFSLDQTAITSILPAVAKDLHVGSSFSWIGASFFVTSTSVQLVTGRLSQIFGLKSLMLTSLSVMAIGNILSGLASQPWQLFATRAVTGFGSGSINALIQVVITDTVPLKERGYFDSILAVLGNTGSVIGPLAGGFLADRASWRLAFHLLSVMIGLALVLLVITLPESKASGKTWNKFRALDWSGLVTVMAAIILLLVPLSQGGNAIPWNSPILIAMLVTGFLLMLLFVRLELRAFDPIVPVHLFTKSLPVNLLLGHYFIFGWIFWVNLYYIPLYFQNALHMDASKAGFFIMPRLMSQLVFSLLSGIYISKTDGYYSTLVVGALVWVIASLWKALFTLETPAWEFIAQGVLEGFSQGCSSLPALIALLALCEKEDRSIIPGLRSFFRTLGGAIGTIGTHFSTGFLESMPHTSLR
ncbi:MFS general substrate transporter [Pseudovirgaria hyperparasitica]|uniref:MFS general substrate transporter n=1 Tax=Pseudovirgaria hyperparasitica TaxID=470096 RepID=A0A6A6VWD9_9PEZI|nr:MFS general substrate transporter [Pseudovirgaria hyperparasitica]KAF2753567.1 MFS general substrate transporter [Pseudovirgaria hyperparasitica]